MTNDEDLNSLVSEPMVLCPRCLFAVPTGYLHCSACDRCMEEQAFDMHSNVPESRRGRAYRCKSCRSDYQNKRNKTKTAFNRALKQVRQDDSNGC